MPSPLPQPYVQWNKNVGLQISLMILWEGTRNQIFSEKIFEQNLNVQDTCNEALHCKAFVGTKQCTCVFITAIND